MKITDLFWKMTRTFFYNSAGVKEFLRYSQLFYKLDRLGNQNIISSNNMDQDDFVIFAELDRDRFDEIVQTLMRYFENIQYGRQGDDWIWIHMDEDENIEIDSFFSMNLEVKGKYQHLPVVKRTFPLLKDDWILKVFDPPKLDTTR